MNTPMNTLNTQIYEEATEWIIRHRSDDLDAEAKRRFDAWVRESPQHLKAYLEMSTIWEDVPTLNRDWNPSADELIVRARAEANVFPLAVEKMPSSTVPGTGGSGGIGTVPLVAAGSEQPVLSLEDLKGLEPLEALKALNDIDESTSSEKVPGTGAFGVVGTVPEPKLQHVPVVTVPASQSMLMKLLAVAATLILTAGVSGWFYLQRNTYTTDIGEQRTLALSDGSSVELNARSKIRVAYTDQARTIELLQGQALFKVAKDPNRPFVVESDGTRVRAVGTQFDVYKKPAGTQVTVVEGRVAVLSGLSREVPTARRGIAAEMEKFSGPSRPGHEATASPSSSPASASHSNLQAQIGEVLLSAGEQILIAQAAPKLVTPEPNVGTVPILPNPPTPAPQLQAALTPQPANIEAATAWTQQRLVFDFAPLTEVAEEFNRYNRRPMKVDCGQGDSAPAGAGDPCNFNISGSFSSTDPTLLLRFLREQPGIVVNETSDEIRISRQNTHG